MFDARTLRLLGVFVAVYAVLIAASRFGPSPFQMVGGYLIIVPFLSIYLFHRIGIPGLLEHNGLCGFGWCSPTPFGWIFLVTVWVLAAWVMAFWIARRA